MLSITPTRRELLAWALAVVLAVTAVTLTRTDNVGAGVTGPSTDVVYLATGSNFPDALGAGPAAGTGLGPILLVQQDAIPGATMGELQRLQPSTIVIVGGTAVISPGVQSTLEALPWSPTVERLAGANRFETAAALSAETFPTTGFYGRAAHTTNAEFTVSTVGTPVAVVDIVAPAPGILLINGGFSIETIVGGPISSEWSGCFTRVNNSGVAGSAHHSSVFEVAGVFERTVGSCVTNAGVAVPAGTHTVDLLAFLDDGTTDETNASLTVLWVPFDGFGATPLP